MKNTAIVILIICVVIYACKKDKPDENLPPYHPTPFVIDIPANLPQMQIPEFNPTTYEGVALGRMLYYDPILHPSGLQSCASCHLQSAGFTTPGSNIIPHVNMGYHNKFLWNGSLQGTLEDAMMFEVEDFFGTDISKLQQNTSYPALFYQAFGTTRITSTECAYALAQYLRTVISGNSRFDKFIRHEINLTLDEMRGFDIFNTEKGDCFHCHSLSRLTDGELHNIGLDSVFAGVNAGYYNESGNVADLGKFKSPSLRNCGIRSSFMHDGRFSTLEEVIEHYDNQVKLSPSLDPIMTKPFKEFGLELTPIEKSWLIAFLHTLTDSTFLNDPKYSNPF